MATELLEGNPASQPPADPFSIGYRYLHTRNPAGEIIHSEKVPLTEEDFLHPQFEDRWMRTDPHSIAIWTLRSAFSIALREKTGFRVFADHRVDWQHPGILPHGPDVVVFGNFPTEWKADDGTLRIRDLGAKVLAVFEVTSESTRHVDFGRKFEEYAEAGIPHYIVIDLASPNGVPEILGFRLSKGEFRVMRRDPELGYMVPELGLFFRLDGDAVIVADVDGRDIATNADLAFELDAARGDIEIEKMRADQHRAKAKEAEAEKLKALELLEAEKAKAAAAEACLEALTRELESLRAGRATN